ncbi:cell division protein FtsL [Candidatus Dojkabacteria bacterium]|nr:cell division protein FtsL [Candidatus Dojkabacteria bacterium]
MNLDIFKRKLKTKISSISQKTNKRVSILNISTTAMVVVVLLFCVVQLSITTILSPQGKILERLDNEKTSLVEENRELELQIAQFSSLTIIEQRAESDLGMKKASNLKFVDITVTNAEITTSAINE